MMNAVSRDIYKAIHEGKWLRIEYRNLNGDVTIYWIGIRNLEILSETLNVDGFHLGLHSITRLPKIYISSILSSQVIEGTYYPVNPDLVRDIEENSYRYKKLFDNPANLKILDYLEACNRLDYTPYCKEYNLIQYLDRDRIDGKRIYLLTDAQFREIVSYFQEQTKDDKERMDHCKPPRIRSLVINELSIHTKAGLYVLAYRKLHFDIKQKCLRPDEDITICSEFTMNGTKESIRKYLDADNYGLLEDFEGNQEKIKDEITRNNRDVKVDDMPYVIGLEGEVPVDLHREYGGILDSMRDGTATIPIQAFFGNLLDRPRTGRRNTSPALIESKVNMDQLLAIHNAMKFPLTYVQGPPGTGKTSTIVNTIATAYFHERTVLFSSYNNNPIDGVYGKLSSLRYRGKRIPLPILRLGNVGKVKSATKHIRELYELCADVTIYDKTLLKRKEAQVERVRMYNDLMRRYDEYLDLQDRKETLQGVLAHQKITDVTFEMISFEADLEGRQLSEIDRQIAKLGDVSEQTALQLLDARTDWLYEFFYYTSAQHIQRLKQAQYDDLRDIIYDENDDSRVERFNRYISKTDNLKKLQRVFPIILTTCIGAHRLGEPEPSFDLVIMDEASQCNTALSLIPILRGSSLMLVGDPQQLNPVILLDDHANELLRKKYQVGEEYDYKKNSIYKTFLACDSVSDEILLRSHYRCHAKIIGFNNKKYYNGQLKICSGSASDKPLRFVDTKEATCSVKNTSPDEARTIVQFVSANRDKSIGVITPFVNQRQLIEQELKRNGLSDIPVGTVHAFQGDEKDIVVFSTAITGKTQQGSYDWLKNNRELINVATSRAREELIMLCDRSSMERLHKNDSADDLYELMQYMCSNGKTAVLPRESGSRALGVKPFSTETEEAFLENLTHALENIWLTQSKYSIHKEVPISQVFQDNSTYDDLFYMGRFDFVIFQLNGRQEIPVLAIELDGKEHYENSIVQNRDRKKNAICKAHNLQIIRVDNSYARRYNHIKEILINYFKVMH